MRPFENRLNEIKTLAQSAKDGVTPIEEFHKVITPSMVLALLKLLDFAEEDIKHLQESAQTLDMGCFELASLFGDDKNNISMGYIFDVVEKVRVLLGRNTANA